MENLKSHVEALAVEIGPRGAATHGERGAAAYISRQLSQMGYKPFFQPFATVTSFSWAYGIYYGLFVVAALLFCRYPAPAFFLVLLNGIAYLLECHTIEMVSRLLPKKKSQNVIARLPGSHPAASKVVITAHYDTSRAALNFSPRMVGSFRQSFLIMNLSMLAIFLLYGLAFAATLMNRDFNRQIIWLISLPFAFYLLITVGFLAHREIFGRFTPGANDNASGVAVLLGVAKEYIKNPDAGKDVWFVATGAEEAGTVGMLRFLEKYRDELAGAAYINLDNLGTGQLSYVTAEGMFIPLKSGKTLVEAARRAVQEKELPVQPRIYRALTTDALPALVRRYPAMSIMAFGAGGILPNWHWYTDTAEHVQEENLQTARELVLEVLRNQ